MRGHRVPIVAAALIALAPACTVRIGSNSGSSASSSEGGRRTYNVVVEQVRHGEGITSVPERISKISARIEETSHQVGTSIVVRRVKATGEPAVVKAAERLVGKTASLTSGPGGFVSVGLGLDGADDLSPLDIGLLFQVLTPSIPAGTRPGGAWQRSIGSLSAPWGGGLTLEAQHRLLGRRWVRWVQGTAVWTEATGTLTFVVPVAVPAQSTPSNRTPLVDEVFMSLFGPSGHDDLASGVTKAIAAIPFAVAAPFLAIADALSGLFGSSGSKPTRQGLPLSGPIALRSTTSTGGSDGRVLEATGEGSMHLTGQLPHLTGDAAPLSRRPLVLDARWVYSRKLVGPWPFGLLGPALLLLLGDTVALVIVMRRRRRSSLSAAPIVPAAS